MRPNGGRQGGTGAYAGTSVGHGGRPIEANEWELNNALAMYIVTDCITRVEKGLTRREPSARASGRSPVRNERMHRQGFEPWSSAFFTAQGVRPVSDTKGQDDWPDYTNGA